MRIDRRQYDKLDPEQREEVDAYLSQLAQIAEQNPLVKYQPHSKQAEFHSAHTRVKAFLGGNRSGKTTAGIVDDLIQACDEEALPARLRAFKRWGKGEPFHCRIVTPDFTSTMEGVVFQKLREWTPKSQFLGGNFSSAYNKQKRILHFANGSSFSFLTYEQDLDKHGGAALHRVHFDEEPPEDIFNECAARIIDYGGDLLLTMTPLHGMTFTYDAIYERRHEQGFTVVQVSTDENPHLDRISMEEFFRGLTDEERRARRDGKFVHFGGLVFGEFDDSRHTVAPIDPEQLEGQQIVIGIDPGIRWTAVVFGAFDSDQSLLVFDELFLTDSTVETTAIAIKQKLASWGLSLKARDTRRPLFVIDPSARNRSLVNAESVEGEFSRFGIYCTPGQNQVEAGVFQIKRRLQSTPPALLVARCCERLLWEMGRYRVCSTPDGHFSVVKVDDHAEDALRYLCMFRPWLAQTAQPKRPPRRWDQSDPSDWMALSMEAPPMGSMS